MKKRRISDDRQTQETGLNVRCETKALLTFRHL